jgi:TrmH family RNA methyltransferase
MITSAQNPKIQWVRSLQARSRERRESQAFVVEGLRLAQEALSAGWEARLVLFDSDLDARGIQVVQGFARQGTQLEEVSPEVMRAASDTQTPQGILIVLPLRILPPPDRLDFVFIPDGVRDPGNLGSMLRTAASAGVEVVFLPPGNVDVYAPKVVRSAMGAHFRTPLRPCNWEEIEEHLKGRRLRVFLADAQRGLAYTQADFRQPLALIIGGEAEGPSQPARKLADEHVHIPMPGGMESLNAGTAAGVLLFEILRQRSSEPGTAPQPPRGRDTP